MQGHCVFVRVRLSESIPNCQNLPVCNASNALLFLSGVSVRHTVFISGYLGFVFIMPFQDGFSQNIALLDCFRAT